MGWVKGSFFKQRRFHDVEDLATQLAQWLQEVNTQRPCRATGVIPQERMVEERKRLRPLRIAPSELALRLPVQVGPTAEVFYDGRGYAMPPEAAGLPATLFLYEKRVKIVAGRWQAEHERFIAKGRVARLPEHRAAHLVVVLLDAPKHALAQMLERATRPVEPGVVGLDDEETRTVADRFPGERRHCVLEAYQRREGQRPRGLATQRRRG